MKYLNLLFCMGLLLSYCMFTSCSKNNSEGEDDGIDYTQFKIVNAGGGAVTTLVPDDGEELEIVQTIPSFSGLAYDKKSSRAHLFGPEILADNAVMGTFPAGLPIMFFFNDKIYLNSIKDNIEIIVDGENIKGTITINEGANGFAILTFVPWKAFKVNQKISITIKKGMQDKSGNEMYADVYLYYQTSGGAQGNFDQNAGFEKGTDGVLFIGDGAVCTGTKGPLGPYDGEKYAAISSGKNLVVTGGAAIGDASSMMVLGPINSELSSVTFYYDFISAEFNDYVDTEYDDCSMFTVIGPKGSYSEFINSVNTIGYDNIAFAGYAGMPDNGDNYAGHIGWTKRTINFTNVGKPAYITFTVTDVSDHILSSILAVDKITY